MARSPRVWIPVIAAVIALVAAATLASVLLREQSVRAEREALESVSRKFASALLSYDSSELDAARTRMRPLVTNKFFANYEATLKALAEVNSSAAGLATEVMVGRAHNDRAAVMVVTESNAQTANGPRASKGAYLRLDLHRTKDGWRVDQVVEIAAGRPEGAEAPPQE